MINAYVTSCKILPPSDTLKGYKIISGPYSSYQDSHRAVVVGELSNGKTVVLCQYFADELSFTESDFVGLTVDECVEVFRARDIAYLRSEM